MDPKILAGIASTDFDAAKMGTTNPDIYKLAEGFQKIAQSLKIIAERQEAMIVAIRRIQGR